MENSLSMEIDKHQNALGPLFNNEVSCCGHGKN